jgi:MFS family permease
LGAVWFNIVLLGAVGPFLTGLVDVIGLTRTILMCMTMLIAGSGLSALMTSPWHLFVTWGVLVGIGSGPGAVGIATAVANRWFARRNGLARGLLFAANAAGQWVFLPLLALIASHFGWRGVSIAVTLVVIAMLPVIALLLPESPAHIGIRPYGAVASASVPAREGNPLGVVIGGLRRASRSIDFW